MTAGLAPAALKQLLRSETEEVAVLDVRERGTYGTGHLLYAASAPIGRLELDIDRLVPRRGATVVLVDEGDDDTRATDAADRLVEFGYTDVRVLEGGMAGWRAANEEVFDGVYVPSKAFGEFVEAECDTPRNTADELVDLKRQNSDMVILDSRPFREYRRMNIPGGVNVPGAELVHRINDLAPNPDTLVVVNCAGRTRSIIGAQSLINAGVPNKVVALENGTMGWTLAGHTLEHGQDRVASDPSSGARAWAQDAAAQVGSRYGVPSIDAQTMAKFRDEAETQTLYLCDVRTAEEYEAGHLPGSRHTPGGQLVQSTDSYVPANNARIVVIDDDGVRATMTASWLIQMGRRNVYVLADGLAKAALESGPEQRAVLGLSDARAAFEIAVMRLVGMLPGRDMTLIDLTDSQHFKRGHIEGAWWTTRRQLPDAIQHMPETEMLVLTSHDGIVAHLAAPEIGQHIRCPVKVLAGGTDAWVAADLPLQKGDSQMIGDQDDVHLLPYDYPEPEIEKAMLSYLEWETALVPRIERDGVAHFDVTARS